MPSVRIWQKKTIVLDQLNFHQRDMVKIGTVGVATVLNRVKLGRGPEDGPAKPLRQAYARFKQRHGLVPRRDLVGMGGQVFLAAGKRRKKAKLSKFGHMLDSFALRTVTENNAKADFSTEPARIKARANNLRETFVVFSPKNRAAVIEAARRALIENKNRLVLQKPAS
jgi:hypothetical protein